MKILIVKIGAIGDVVMAMAVLSSLKDRFPNASITWVTGTIAEPLLRATGLVENLIALPEERLFKGSFLQKLRVLASLWRRLAFRRFDLSLTLHLDWRYKVLAWPIRCKDRRFWSRKKGSLCPVPGRYHAQESLRLAGENREVSFPKLHLPNFDNETRPLIVLAPGGAKNILADDALRRWPITHYASLIKKLSLLPVRLVVTGSAEDVWVKPYLIETLHKDLIGKLGLLELLSLLQQAALLITHDSGPMHLAKLVKCPVIALFGPTRPSEKVGAGEMVTVLCKPLSCSPCYNGKTYAPCTRNRCLEEISPQEVFEKVQKTMFTKYRPPPYEEVMRKSLLKE